MKKTILLSVMLVTFASIINAQSYSINKLKYDSRLYSPEYGDPYNPALSGVCSWMIPGLGQMISGETGRGLAFLGGYTACGVVCMAGFVSAVASGTNESTHQYGSNYTYSSTPKAGGGIMLLGAIGMIAVDIWSIVDAVNVAKVNNMYIRDLKKRSEVSLQVTPYVDQISMSNQLVTPVGLTVRVNF